MGLRHMRNVLSAIFEHAKKSSRLAITRHRAEEGGNSRDTAFEEPAPAIGVDCPCVHDEMRSVVSHGLLEARTRRAGEPDHALQTA
jgi:hypothetical protein